MHPSGLEKQKASIFPNKELDDIKKIVKSFEDADLLTKGISDVLENEVEEQKVGFLGMSVAILGDSLLSSMLTDEGVTKGSDGVIQVCDGVITAGHNF